MIIGRLQYHIVDLLRQIREPKVMHIQWHNNSMIDRLANQATILERGVLFQNRGHQHHRWLPYVILYDNLIKGYSEYKVHGCHP